MNIEYRKMNKSDYPFIKKLIIQSWFSEYKFNDRVKYAYAEAYLRIYLADSNYRIVACDEKKVVAFLFGRHRKVNFFEKYFNLLLLFIIKFYFLFSKSGRRKNRILRITENVNQKLLKKHKSYLENELSLFIVDENYQGQGIGTKLELDFSSYLKSKGERYLYLFTDTYSNYEFYENRNYIKGGELQVDFKIKGEEENPLPYYFIYYKEL